MLFYKSLISRAMSPLVGPQAWESVCLEASLGTFITLQFEKGSQNNSYPKDPFFCFYPSVTQQDLLSKPQSSLKPCLPKEGKGELLRIFSKFITDAPFPSQRPSGKAYTYCFPRSVQPKLLGHLLTLLPPPNGRLHGACFTGLCLLNQQSL